MATSRSVLLIEPDDALRAAIATRLRRAGCSVEAVIDAIAAAAALARAAFDFIVGNGEMQERFGDRGSGTFILIRTPLDLEDLVRVIRTPAALQRDGVDLHALRRFVTSIPSLRDELAAPMPSPRELALRGEIRRTILELSGALEAAAEGETNRARAAMFLAASAAAADLAMTRSAARATGH